MNEVIESVMDVCESENKGHVFQFRNTAIHVLVLRSAAKSTKKVNVVKSVLVRKNRHASDLLFFQVVQIFIKTFFQLCQRIDRYS